LGGLSKKIKIKVKEEALGKTMKRTSQIPKVGKAR
jgi:hypothetical protein